MEKKSKTNLIKESTYLLTDKKPKKINKYHIKIKKYLKRKHNKSTKNAFKKRNIIIIGFFILLFLLFLFIYKRINKCKFNTNKVYHESEDNENNEYKDIKEFEEKDLNFYKNYIEDSYNLKVYKRKIIKKEIPFVSICLAVYNMEKYIERTILNIMNQSFQDFEIVIVNDFSNDKTSIILEKYKFNDKIKIVNHFKNLGCYASRVDGVRNSKGKFIILMDPDDMFLNPDILAILHNYYLKYNLDIIEFKFYKYIEKDKKILTDYDAGRYHNFGKDIIYQPELADLFFYEPGTKKYSGVICRAIWNKINRKEVLLKSYDYLGEDYYKEFSNTAEDTLTNLVSMQFANNYSMINYSGYMYNIREKSTTNGERDTESKIKFDYSYFLYYKKLYGLIKDYNKDRNFLFYEFSHTNQHLLELASLDESRKLEIIKYYQEISEDNKISTEFKDNLKSLIRQIK